jgi:hypothetical protein
VAPAAPQPGYPPPYYAPPGVPSDGQGASPPQYVYPPYGYAPPGYAPPGYAPPGYVAPEYSPYSRRSRRPALNPDDPPPGYHTESRARTGLVVAGGVMLGVSYILSLTGALSAQANGNTLYEPLYVPVVGPFITLGSAHMFQRTGDGLVEAGRVLGSIGLIFDGLIQVTGASLVVAGLAARKDVVVRDSVGDPEVSFGPGGASARFHF